MCLLYKNKGSPVASELQNSQEELENFILHVLKTPDCLNVGNYFIISKLGGCCSCKAWQNAAEVPICDPWFTHILLLLCSAKHPTALHSVPPKDFPNGYCSGCVLTLPSKSQFSRVPHAPSRVDVVNNSSHEKLTRPWTNSAGSPSGSCQTQWTVSTVNILAFKEDTDFC